MGESHVELVVAHEGGGARLVLVLAVLRESVGELVPGVEEVDELGLEEEAVVQPFEVAGPTLVELETVSDAFLELRDDFGRENEGHNVRLLGLVFFVAEVEQLLVVEGLLEVVPLGVLITRSC